ncbi:hypothetical protein [Vitiosangium sp. GDMCC 1.1324]|uniref:hypothetical protein n=1 Tax=Vitiosangium sp. (strain GDMCC 1.1324) TaxID=2138576 RepID=UPI000D39137D|nr:hypothetical protein [Vitiosangium sp. GDMCC 1.1324]PTL75290.1 hypothetical protein DAT35_55625 [Vitiosangium sp. GDMCC 1.1324]
MPSLRSWSRGSLLGVGLLVGGVAAGAPDSPVIAVHLPYESYNLQLSGDDVLSADIQLHRSATELRGRALGTAARLTLKEGGASGVVGSTPVNLKVHKEGDTLLAEGGFVDGRVTLRFNSKELHVYINQCRYELTYTEGWYEGPRSCDSRLAPPVRLSVPPEFLSRSASEQAALLLFALAPAGR